MQSESHKSIQYLEQRLQQELSLDIYRSIEAPKELWKLQTKIRQFLNTTTIPEQEKRTLEQLCKKAREQVATTPDGDEWLEYWK